MTPISHIQGISACQGGPILAQYYTQASGPSGAVVFLVVVAFLLLPLIPASIATSKGRSGAGYYFFGLFLFFPALIVAAVIAPNPVTAPAKKIKTTPALPTSSVSSEHEVLEVWPSGYLCYEPGCDFTCRDYSDASAHRIETATLPELIGGLPPVAATRSEALGHLERLAALRNTGALSDEEFAAAKAPLLKAITV